MVKSWMCFLIAIIGLTVSPDLLSASPEESNSPVKAEILISEEGIQPGRPFSGAIRFTLEPGEHIYWKNPGDIGIPVSVEWDLPPGFEAGTLEWPVPKKFTVAEMTGYGYENEATLITQMIPPQTISDDSVSLKARVGWLVCSGMSCRPGSASVEKIVPVLPASPRSDSRSNSFFQRAEEKIPVRLSNAKIFLNEKTVDIVFSSADLSGKTVRHLSFFPEEQETIDDSQEAEWNATENGEYSVRLHRSDRSESPLHILKGILVVETGTGNTESVQAYDVDGLVENRSENTSLSYADLGAHKAGLSGEPKFPNSGDDFDFRGGFAVALLFAFIGGMILNLMPCVLPVMSIKVMSFVKMAGQSRTLTLKHGLVFTGGVVLSFWALAAAMLLLRAYGQTVGWGFQLQEPLFVVALASLLFIFSLNLFGVFELGTGLSSWAGQTESDASKGSSSYAGSFLSGILATAVATPCTGPFLGSAVGFAVTLPVWQSLAIFTFIAGGMCFPYLILAGFPSLLRLIPKPGAWMETFKQLTGFTLLATVLWLLWVFSAQTNTFSLMSVLAGFLCFSIGAWIYGRKLSPRASKKKRMLVYATAALFAVAGGKIIFFSQPDRHEEIIAFNDSISRPGWEKFSPERVDTLRQEGKPVLIDFTAKWCLICQANHMVLEKNKVGERMAEEGVVKLVADWTKSDPVITRELSKFGRNSVPLYVLYGADGKPVILPQVLTEEVVLNHLNEVVSSGEKPS